MNDVFITSTGIFLPGNPIENDEIESYLGLINGQASHAKNRILRDSGITTRHYAIDSSQRSLFSNSQMAALAIQDALNGSRTVKLNDIELLCASTTVPDLFVPGFASMVHGELGNPPCEIATFHSVCASSVMALKLAWHQIASGEKTNGVVCGSEFASRCFKGSRYEEQTKYLKDNRLPLEADFLRWILSDGAGACVLEKNINTKGISLKVEWVQIKSFANLSAACMQGGGFHDSSNNHLSSFLDLPNMAQAIELGVLNITQDMRLIKNIIQFSIEHFKSIIDSGKIQLNQIDWIACHYSSENLKTRVIDSLNDIGLNLDEDKWFSTLKSRGNIGCASIFVTLDDLWKSGKLKPGQNILCMVPESGRMITCFFMLKVMAQDSISLNYSEAGNSQIQTNLYSGPINPIFKNAEIDSSLSQPLLEVWDNFVCELRKVDIVRRIFNKQCTLQDYRKLLLNLRAQVIDGSCWIARAASNIGVEAFTLRSLFLQHAVDEHRDFRLLESDFLAAGGKLEDLSETEKNIGGEALSAWIFHRASLPNPIDLLGAMFIIEGIGRFLSEKIARQLQTHLNLEDGQTSFLLYHSKNDVDHLNNLEEAFTSKYLKPENFAQIVKTAKVTARLYRLQLDELGNY